MYKVYKNDTLVTVTDKVMRCKAQENGVVIVAQDGTGIIWDGLIHNLPGYEYDIRLEEISDMRNVIDTQAATAVSQVEAQATYTAMMTDTLMTEE